MCSEFFLELNKYVILKLHLRKLFLLLKTPPLSHTIVQVFVQDTKVNERFGSQFWRGQKKSYGCFMAITKLACLIFISLKFHFP